MILYDLAKPFWCHFELYVSFSTHSFTCIYSLSRYPQRRRGYVHLQKKIGYKFDSCLVYIWPTYDQLTAIVRCLNSNFRAVSEGGRTIFVHVYRRVAVASTIMFNSELYKKKNCKPVACRHIVGASHDPHTGTASWSHGDRVENPRF